MKTWKEAGPGTVALEVTVPGTPQPGGSKKAFLHKTTGALIVTDTNPKAKPWMKEVATIARYARGHLELEHGPLEVLFRFFLARPASVPEHKRPLPIVRPDVLKLARAVEDALTGIVWRDDAQIVNERLEKRYGLPERVEVTVCRL